MEILAVPSMDLVGWLPDELQDYKSFTWAAAVTTNAKHPDQAKALRLGTAAGGEHTR